MNSGFSWLRFAAAGLALAAAACGSVIDPHQGAGSGGASSTSSMATGTTGTGGAPASCGGDTGIPCGPDTYGAVSLFTNVPRFAILKVSPARNLCFRLTIALGAGGVGIPGISGAGVTVESALVTHDAGDCTVPGGPLPVPKGATYPVVSGMGTVSVAMSATGCLATIHGKVVFSGQPAWAPPSELLDADDLVIFGGCP